MEPLSPRVKVLMVIAVLYGFFGCCCGLPTLFFGQTPIELPEGIDSDLAAKLEVLVAQQQVIVEQPVIRVWSYLTALLSVCLGIAHFGCFWGYLQRKTWAKQLHLILALIKIVENLMGSVIHALYFDPAFSMKMGQELAGLGTRLFSSLLGTTCFLLLPGMVIVLILTDTVKNKSKPATEPSDLNGDEGTLTLVEDKAEHESSDSPADLHDRSDNESIDKDLPEVSDRGTGTSPDENKTDPRSDEE